MFITMNFTNRERYCKAVRYLMENRDKYNFLNSGKDYGAMLKAPKADHGWYVYFSKRVQKRTNVMIGTWIENNERHCTRQFAIEHGIIDENDTVTTCKLWCDEYVYIH